ncbi:MAG: hypothetical protein WAU45_13365 [Blastocatellia bacterium]
MAFRREQPPVDFTDRVLEQIARQPKPRLRWWQTLAAMLQPPRLKWVAIGATAGLLVAIGAAQYSQLHPPVIDDTDKVAGVPSAGVAGTAPTDSGAVKVSEPVRETPAPKLEPKPRRNNDRNVVAVSNRRQQNIRPENRVSNPEAEAAKEKVMLALYITSAALNDAQRAIREDHDKPQR